MNETDASLRYGSDNFSLPSYLTDFSIIGIYLPAIFFAIAVYSTFNNRQTIKAPYVGYRAWFEPTFLLRLRFVNGARSIITQGYQQV
jgi:hypothetical protein